MFGWLLQLGTSQSRILCNTATVLTLLEVQFVVRSSPSLGRSRRGCVIVEEIEACLKILACAIWNEPEKKRQRVLAMPRQSGNLTCRRKCAGAFGWGLRLVSAP